MAKFLLKSHFLSICNNMIVKQHINHGAIQKVCHLHNGICPSVNLYHTFLNFTLSPPLCYSLKITNYGMREIWLLQRITLYQRRLKIVSLDTIAYLETYKQPILTKKCNYNNFVQILYSYLR